VTKFGETLRTFRQSSNDPDYHKRRLSQGRLGELIGHEMGDRGVSGAAVSDWERGESKINVEDRNVLIAIIKVLYKCGGLKTRDDANQLLEAGNYRALNTAEAQEIFGEIPAESRAEQPVPEQKSSISLIAFLMENLFAISGKDFQDLFANAEKGPPPLWPRVLVSILRRFSDRLSVFKALKFFLWVWIWLLAWVLITPSLRWPFSSQDDALLAVVIYAAGSILVPALISVLTNTKDNKFWREKESVRELTLRVYIHQGASVGFHVGYFFVFMIGLLRYNLGLQSVTWIEFIYAVFLITLGYASAGLVPYNLLKAYEQLSLKDGKIFFIFFLVGPAWGYFFFESYDLLLTKTLGIFVVLSSITLLLVMMALRYRQSGTTIIPVHWWVIFWAAIVICQFLVFFINK
jgi:hypothetical protein